jgi:uncharacterized protein YjbJ (UPF0337 family)
MQATHKHRTEVVRRRVRASLKEALGKVTGDRQAEAEGRAEQRSAEVHARSERADTNARDAIRR